MGMGTVVIILVFVALAIIVAKRKGKLGSNSGFMATIYKVLMLKPKTYDDDIAELTGKAAQLKVTADKVQKIKDLKKQIADYEVIISGKPK
ncbi:hypothetical protein M0R04_08115 [Candidatus Dojkabacteria bacterium]|jgi:hypothetical protein|nr:hypothetical protein [Candidatus Dojkabacteria bacterium]